MSLYDELPWSEPACLDDYPNPETWREFVNASIPRAPGVYVFSEFAGALQPNPPWRDLRSHKCILYVGKASNLNTRVRGYRFRPYLDIPRRRGDPRHVADSHKGRALIHAAQFFENRVYLRWVVQGSPKLAESRLIQELKPVLNTKEMDAGYFSGEPA